ncbi:hypothetical protein ACFP3U_27310 [Kitasatospora misakiensis]|uniref:Chaplin domain-containing protein n=1 Tax=Kitasatospora misakiensis TaxID=67330 RepID=A0ABW0XA22_9ACTN
MARRPQVAGPLLNLTASVVGGATIGSDSPYVLIPVGGIPVGNVGSSVSGDGRGGGR